MTTCKQLERLYPDYVCDFLDEEQVSVIREHLLKCPVCAREIQSLQRVLALTEEAGNIPIPNVILDDMEMKVYKRLAAESPQSKGVSFFSQLFSPFRSLVARNSSTWILSGAIATCTLAIGISITTTFFNRKPSPDTSVSVLAVQQTPLEQYIQEQEIQVIQEALETKHLKGDDRSATLQLRLVADRNLQMSK